jgi:hypothetical protein
MAMTRCPECNAPLTEEEARSGACPMCTAELARAAPTALRKSAPPPVRTSSVAVLWAVVGAIAFCFLPVGIIFYHMLPDPPVAKKMESKPPAAIEQRTQGKN